MIHYKPMAEALSFYPNEWPVNKPTDRVIQTIKSLEELHPHKGEVNWDSNIIELLDFKVDLFNALRQLGYFAEPIEVSAVEHEEKVGILTYPSAIVDYQTFQVKEGFEVSVRPGGHAYEGACNVRLALTANKEMDGELAVVGVEYNQRDPSDRDQHFEKFLMFLPMYGHLDSSHRHPTESRIKKGKYIPDPKLDSEASGFGVLRMPLQAGESVKIYPPTMCWPTKEVLRKPFTGEVFMEYITNGLGRRPDMKIWEPFMKKHFSHLPKRFQDYLKYSMSPEQVRDYLLDLAFSDKEEK
jgi:hypothetical protein